MFFCLNVFNLYLLLKSILLLGESFKSENKIGMINVVSQKNLLYLQTPLKLPISLTELKRTTEFL